MSYPLIEDVAETQKIVRGQELDHTSESIKRFPRPHLQKERKIKPNKSGDSVTISSLDDIPDKKTRKETITLVVFLVILLVLITVLLFSFNRIQVEDLEDITAD